MSDTEAKPPAAHKPPPLTEADVRRSLRVSVKDGVAWSVMVGAGERYVHPFVIQAGAGVFNLALIAALPAMAGALIMWLAANVTDAVGRRKHIFVLCSHLQATMWIPLCAAIFLPQPASFIVMLGAFIVYTALHAFSIPAWTSVMGDLVPADRRGRYYGKRNLLVGSANIATFLLAGAWVTFASRTESLAMFGVSSQFIGFAVLFAVAGVARVFSARFLAQMAEPPYHRQSSDRFSLLDFIRRAPKANYGRFVIYCAMLHFGCGFVGPYFTWYVLDQLGLPTFAFACIGTVHMMVYFPAGLLWGRLADRVGNKRIMTICGFAITAIPFLLMFCRDAYTLAAVQVYDGIVWAGFNIAAANYFFDIVTPGKRARCTAYNSLFVTTGMSLGFIGGAIVITLAPTLSETFGVFAGFPFGFILVISAVLRLVPNVLLLHTFREWRLVAPHEPEPLRPETVGEV